MHLVCNILATWRVTLFFGEKIVKKKWIWKRIKFLHVYRLNFKGVQADFALAYYFELEGCCYTLKDHYVLHQIIKTGSAVVVGL